MKLTGAIEAARTIPADKETPTPWKNLAEALELLGEFEWHNKDFRAAEFAYSQMLRACEVTRKEGDTQNQRRPPAESPGISSGTAAPQTIRPVLTEEEKARQDLIARAYDGLGSMRHNLKEDAGAREPWNT